jgi:hypothetical protein
MKTSVALGTFWSLETILKFIKTYSKLGLDCYTLPWMTLYYLFRKEKK